jgi:hypothetical protein
MAIEENDLFIVPLTLGARVVGRASRRAALGFLAVVLVVQVAGAAISLHLEIREERELVVLGAPHVVAVEELEGFVPKVVAPSLSPEPTSSSSSSSHLGNLTHLDGGGGGCAPHAGCGAV